MAPSTNKRRIIAFNHSAVYPPRAGGAVRVFEILKNLARNGYSVKLYAYGQPSALCISDVEMYTIPKPFLPLIKLGELMASEEGKIAIGILLNVHPKLAQIADAEIRLADIVQTEHLWASLFGLVAARKNGKPSVFDDHNAEYFLAQSSYGELNGRARLFQPLWAKVVKNLEGTCCKLADVILVTSEYDRRLLSETYEISPTKIHVVENGVNTDEIYPSEICRSQVRKGYGFHESDPALLFLGKYDYPPNMYTAGFIVRTLAPIIFARYPNAKILMVGRNPPLRLTTDPRIIWTGEVENVMPYINACDVALAPLPLGSGTRLKVLSYLACDRPVVATPEACEGLRLKDGRHVLVRTLENFAEAVNGLLEDPDSAAELAAGASTFTKSSYDWKVTVSKLTEIYSRIL